MIDKIISWNVRGVNDRNKRTVIKGCLGRWKADLVCLQESKVDACDMSLVKSLWKTQNIGYHFLPARITAGGIVKMWNEDRLQCMDV